MVFRTLGLMVVPTIRFGSVPMPIYGKYLNVRNEYGFREYEECDIRLFSQVDHQHCVHDGVQPCAHREPGIIFIH